MFQRNKKRNKREKLRGPEKAMQELIEADQLMRKHNFSDAFLLIKRAVFSSSLRGEELAYGYYLLGVVRLKCGRFFLAKEALQEAAKLLPGKPENLRTLGYTKVMLGEVEEGRKDIREAINSDLTYVPAYVDLAMSYFYYLEFESGWEFLKTAQNLASQDSFVKTTTRIAEEMYRDFQKASPKEREKIKKEKLDPQNKKTFRIEAIKYFLKNHPKLSSEEADEIEEELRRNEIILPWRN